MIISPQVPDQEKLRQIVQAFQGNIGVFDNLAVDGTVVWIVAAPFVDTLIPHGLGHVPTGYIVYRSSGLANVYDSTAGTANWSDTNIELRTNGSAGTVFYLMVF